MPQPNQTEQFNTETVPQQLLAATAVETQARDSILTRTGDFFQDLGHSIIDIAHNSADYLRHKAPVLAAIGGLAVTGAAAREALYTSDSQASVGAEQSSLTDREQREKRVMMLARKYKYQAGLSGGPGGDNDWSPTKRNYKIYAYYNKNDHTNKRRFYFKLRNGTKYGAMWVEYQDENSPNGISVKFPKLTKRTKMGGYYVDKTGTALNVIFLAK